MLFLLLNPMRIRKSRLLGVKRSTLLVCATPCPRYSHLLKFLDTMNPWHRLIRFSSSFFWQPLIGKECKMKALPFWFAMRGQAHFITYILHLRTSNFIL